MTKLKRRSNWRSLLLAYVQTCSKQPFEMGVHDCALFAAGAVKAMTGEDLAANWRGRYKTLRGGLRVLKSEGFSSHVNVAAQNLPEIPALTAGVGDIALVHGDEGEALGVVQGPWVYVLRTDGLGFVNLSDVLRAFRV